MRCIIQRVSEAKVLVEGNVVGEIGKGFLVLAGWEETDTEEDLIWMAGKIARLRVFNDDNEAMNLGLDDVNGAVLLVSQFTLHASTKKGNRPSFIRAAKPETAIPLYEKFKKLLQIETGKPIQTGTFGAHMNVSLINDGPVTIMIDSKAKE